MNRRQFLKRTLAVGATVAAGTVTYAIGYEPHWLELVERPLPVVGLPAALQGATLAQVSDLHVGPQVSDAYLTEALDRLAARRPDIVVFTGDFISYREARGEAQYTQLAQVLAHFPQGRLATVGILGNHDYGVNWRQPQVAARVAATAAAAGIRILRNEVHTVAGLEVVGVDDLWSGLADSVAALGQCRGGPALVLCHNPDAQDVLPWPDYRGWVLAGHTHGGQCRPPFLPPPIIPVRNARYTAGVIAVNDQRTLYISRGVGHLLRARFMVRPEITLFTLSAAG